MKPIVLTSLLLVAGTAAQAQFSLLPQVGFEQSRTCLNYGSDLSAADLNGNFKAGLRADYRLKGGHSPFVNLTTSPSPVSFAFNNAGTLVGRSQPNHLQFRFEGGYQYSSKPIALGKKSSAAKTPVIEATRETVVQRSRCGSISYKSHCSSKKLKTAKTALAGNGLNMRLQPSLGLAYIPSSTERVKTTAEGLEYTAAAWKTALVPAMGFEFAKGRQRLLTLTVFYTRPLEQMDETVTYGSGVKAVSLPLQTRTSTWGMTVGVPLGFTKAPHTKVKKERKECSRTYYRRCIRVVEQ